MTIDGDKITSRAIAVVCVILGFAIGAIAVLDHVKAAGESAWSILPFVLAGVFIFFGAYILDPTGSGGALDKIVDAVPIVGALIASRRAGGDRATDPPLPGSPDALPAPALHPPASDVPDIPGEGG